MTEILWIVLIVVVLAWLAGLVFKVAGKAIHLLLVLAVVILLVNLLGG